MTNKETIGCFYSVFARGDAERMSQCYHDDVLFTDPAFGTLKGEQAKSMWKMLIERSNGNIDIQFNDIKADSHTGSAKWTAKYEYGPQKREVINHITATFEFKDGKIIAHRDDFDMWKWSRQTLGTTGVLLGWSTFMKNKI
ncbi:nuclear transport factor 2 family protein [Bacteroidia bacterium]|nr:nuclear transport factor 2 family protein [Bacteroidia bacterium]MDB9881667.1 nuclear transport factor 2 family protein [Bacteroidia bacterium]